MDLFEISVVTRHFPNLNGEVVHSQTDPNDVYDERFILVLAIGETILSRSRSAIFWFSFKDD